MRNSITLLFIFIASIISAQSDYSDKQNSLEVSFMASSILKAESSILPIGVGRSFQVNLTRKSSIKSISGSLSLNYLRWNNNYYQYASERSLDLLLLRHYILNGNLVFTKRLNKFIQIAPNIGLSYRIGKEEYENYSFNRENTPSKLLLSDLGFNLGSKVILPVNPRIHLSFGVNYTRYILRASKFSTTQFNQENGSTQNLVSFTLGYGFNF